MLNDVISQAKVKDKLTFRADSSGCLSWHCNAAYALYDDFRSHTGSTFSMGDGAITSLSRIYQSRAGSNMDMIKQSWS